MVKKLSNVFTFMKLLERKAPEYLDLVSSKTSAEFEDAFIPLLEKAIQHLEKNKLNFKRLDENGLTGVIAGSLTIPGLTVNQELNSNGHVDIVIEANNCFPSRTKLGEAKIDHSPSHVLKGLDQLIGRYSTGREEIGLILIYVKNKPINESILAIREKIDNELPQNQTCKTKDYVLKWSFLSEHIHSSDEKVEVCHIGCNLF